MKIRILVIVCSALVLLISGILLLSRLANTPTAGTAADTPAVASLPTEAPMPQRPPFFAHYYLWWDAQHWRAKLGDAYPYSQAQLPLPAELGADECTATSAYQHNQLLDIPALPLGLYSQDDAPVLDAHIQQAADAGLAGFVVSWSGNGQADQTISSTAFNRRLDSLIRQVSQYNAAHSPPFHLILGYQGLNNDRAPRPVDWIRNDLRYFLAAYQHSPVFQIPDYHNKIVIMLLDSRKFAVDDIAKVSSIFGSQRNGVDFIGDEHGEKEWNRGVGTYFDGDGWYWSDENPYANRSAFKSIASLADTLRSQQKLWFSPLSGGYNKSNFDVGGSCIPRRSGETLKLVYQGNKASNPDGWMYISWNEFFENTYIEPSVRHGRYYLDVLKSIIAAN